MKEVEMILKEHQGGCCEAIRDAELESRLAAISAPTLVITGADDPAAPVNQAELMRDPIPTPAS